MSSIEIRAGTRSEIDGTMALLMLAFAADPSIRALYAESALYAAHFMAFAAVYSGQAFDHRSADLAADHGGAALWLPPGVEQDVAGLGAVVV